MIIYKITNRINGKLYVGQTTQTLQERWQQHVWDASKPRCRHYPFYRAMCKYGKESFQIESICEATSIEELNELEQYWISMLQTTDRLRGYNVAPGGYGHLTSAETKQKIKLALIGKMTGPNNPRWGKPGTFLGKNHTEETKKLIKQKLIGLLPGDRNPFYGQHHTAENRQLMSAIKQKQYIGEGNPFFGKHHSEETIQKIKDSHVGQFAGEKHPRYRHDVDNNKIKELYAACHNASEVGRQLSLPGYFVGRRCRAMGLV